MTLKIRHFTIALMIIKRHKLRVRKQFLTFKLKGFNNSSKMTSFSKFWMHNNLINKIRHKRIVIISHLHLVIKEVVQKRRPNWLYIMLITWRKNRVIMEKMRMQLKLIASLQMVLQKPTQLPVAILNKSIQFSAKISSHQCWMSPLTRCLTLSKVQVIYSHPGIRNPYLLILTLVPVFRIIRRIWILKVQLVTRVYQAVIWGVN